MTPPRDGKVLSKRQLLRTLVQEVLLDRQMRDGEAPVPLQSPAAPGSAVGAGAAGAGGGPRVEATFMGVSTLLFTDGRSRVLTDGFFTRPGLLRLRSGRLAPDRRRISAALYRLAVTELDAVVVLHSHVDHALDSATVARTTGAWLVGSASTRQIARGEGFPAELFLPLRDGESLRFGDFTLEALPSVHSPGDRLPGVIDTPLRTPARLDDYKAGDCYSLFVEHQGRRLLVHASAGFIPGALDGQHAETVYLGIGTLGTLDQDYRDEYWRQVVETVGARRVVPIHWDNFARSLRRPLRPLPPPIDDVPTSLRWLRQRADATGVRVELPRLAVPASPW